MVDGGTNHGMNLIIEIPYIMHVCQLSHNIAQDVLSIHIKEAQEDLQDVLGGEFYEEIASQYAAQTLSADNQTLYDDYVKDFLAWKTYHDYLGFSQSASTPTGERSFNDENSTLLVDVALYSKEKNIREKAVKKKFRLINYLRNERSKDSTKFPKWVDTCKEEMSFAITSVSRDSRKDNFISVNKSNTFNE